MDFHSVMETFAEAWVAANTHTPLTQAAEQGLINGHNSPSPNPVLINLNPPSLTLLQETSKHSDTEIFPVHSSNVNESNRLNQPHSPGDSRSNCSSTSELRHKQQDVHGKSLPVHCIVEQSPGLQACGQYVELDSFAIVPSDTLFSDLVRTALGKLGYSVTQIVGAKGSIQVKKWKPLAFDQVTENPEATVEDILGDLTTIASLHVRLYSVPDNPQEWKDLTVRNAVLELLREMSQIKLAKICPLSQPMLSNIINNRYLGKIGKEKCQEFGQWYLSYRKQHPEGITPDVVPSDRPVDGRLTFHPSKELPMMRDWFRSCQNPSRKMLQIYVDLLNQGPVRQQERPKIALTTLKNWWKNEKQRERKNQRSEEDNSPKPARSKRKKKTDVDDPPKSTAHADLQNFDAQKEHTNSNKFTLINHETDSDLDRFNQKENDIGEILVDQYPTLTNLDVTKPNCNFPLLAHEAEMESHLRHVALDNKHGIQTADAQISLEKDSSSESPYFQKIHSVCIDNPHIFSYPDSNVPLQCNAKKLCDKSVKTSIDCSNSHISSEDDVDVCI